MRQNLSEEKEKEKEKEKKEGYLRLQKHVHWPEYNLEEEI